MDCLDKRLLLLIALVAYGYTKPAGNSVDEKSPRTNIDERSIDWLQRFGYFVRPDPRVGELLSEKMLSKSLVQLQRFAGLKVTGVLDKETKKLMGQSRCGVADFGPSDLTRRKRRYALQGTQWKKMDLTWRLTNDNNDGLSRNEVVKILEKAFSRWASRTDLKFKQITSGEADIMISFEKYYHQDAYPFDGEGGLLAHAFYPHNNKGISGDIHFDDDEQFTQRTKAGKNLLFVAIHEIGHSLGLEHSNVRDAIMYPWYPGYKGEDLDLTYDDIVGIQTIYGSRSPTTPAIGATTLKPKTTAVAPTLPPKVCLNNIKSIFLGKDKRSYIINDDKLYILRETLGIEKGPIDVSSYFQGVKQVDAAYRRFDGNTVLFSGQNFYTFDGNRKLSGPTRIIDHYRGLPPNVTKIDAAFIWSGNGRTYLFSGENYWRYDRISQSIDPGYPKLIVPNWNGVPSNIDAVFIWKNGLTYFFKGTEYYRLRNSPLGVDPSYPKPIAREWMKCRGDLKARDTNGGHSIQSSSAYNMFPALLSVIVAKLLC